MSVVIPLEGDEHASVQSLLPWYARGQLDEAEHLQVQRHLSGCAACRQELAAEGPLQTLMQGAAVGQAGDVEAGLARLRPRLQPGSPPRQPMWLRWAPWAMGLQAAALATGAVAWWAGRPPAPAYEGLAAPGSAVVEADALVIFKPGVREDEVRALLLSQGATVVSGPTEAGAWLLRTGPQGLVGVQASALVQLAQSLRPVRSP